MRVTADTNVLVYSLDGRDLLKREIARCVLLELARRGADLPLQVLGELQNVLLRRLRRPRHEVVAAVAHMLSSYGSFGYARDDVIWALDALANGHLSYWDALLLSSARSSGHSVLLSEDMGDGRSYDGIEIVNPFGPSGPSGRVRAILSI